MTSTKNGLIGADTTFLIDFFKGEENAVEFMRRYTKLLRVSELVIYEFLCGNLTDKQRGIFFEAMQSFIAVNFNPESAIMASNLFRDAKENGKSVGHQDCMIAGSYCAHGINNIVTRNAKHFRSLQGINPVSF